MRPATTQNTSPQKAITPLSLIFLSLLAVINIREYPILAQQGKTALAYMLVAFLGFLLPVTWACSLLSKHSNSNGGIYQWFKQALGPNWAVVGMLLEWQNNLINFPVSLAVMVTSLSYCLPTQPHHHSLWFFIAMSAVSIMITAIACSGLQISTRVIQIAAMLGILLPSVALIVIACLEPYHPHTLIHSTQHAFWPGWSLAQWSICISVLSSVAGIQATSFYTEDIKASKKNLSNILLLSACLIFIIMTGASLAMATLLPSKQVDMMAGFTNAFSYLANEWQLAWLLPCVIILFLCASIGSMLTWFIGLARGMASMANDQLFWSKAARQNDRGMPQNMLILQCLIVIALAFFFVLIKNTQEVFWVLLVLTGQLVMIMNGMLFLSSWQLCRHALHPIKQKLLCLACLLGTMSCIFGFLSTFNPLSALHIHHVIDYRLMLLGLDALLIIIPWAWANHRTKHRHELTDQQVCP